MTALELASLLAGAAAAVGFVGAVLYARAPAEKGASDFLREAEAGPKRFDLAKAIDDSPIGQRIAQDLAAAGMTRRPSSFLFLTAGILAGALLVLPGMFGDIALLIAPLAAAIPYVFVRRRAGQHLRQFKRQLPAVLDLLANSLRAGQSEPQAFALVGTEMQGAAAIEFKRMQRAIELGATVDSVTEDLLRRIPDPDLELVVDAVQLAHRVGGNLPTMLADIAKTIRDRSRLEMEVNALTAQVRASVYLVTALVPLGVLAISLLNPEWGRLLFQTTAGRVILGVAFGLELVGYVVAKRASVVEV